ncbi:hypothetical protein [Mesorhizobium sp.]|uniref:hypothetical protein n=1 Tax=Mesorhizobium sp. TaxID=1871066 RepID=UPI000FE5DD27|nr:hypothetical protein [Mesorhizobium sp.]RWA70617.1 MAG: hypothetical protein EOQ29_13660 [Mesorhizobium sp.]RWA83432.1 MAG: hypothetical protein EOQ30_13025 [Mesorhizobium sp.]
MVEQEPKQKRCFVVGPIGGDDSSDRIHADWLLEEIILPVFGVHFKDFVVTRADKITEPGQIDAQVIEALLDSELVIADMTTLNPNAFYEIGIRHVLGMPIVHMHLDGEKIPFDVSSYRSIKFSWKRPRDLREARAALEKSVAAAIKPGHKVDNPVTAARARIELQQHATTTERVLLREIEALRAKVANIEARNAIQATNLTTLSHLQNRSLGGAPSAGMVRFEFSVRSPDEEQTMVDLIDSLGLGGDLFSISADETWREVDIPFTMVSQKLLRAVGRQASTAEVKVTVTDDKGNLLLQIG